MSLDLSHPVAAQDPGYHWWSWWTECALCGHRCVTVIEIPVELDEPAVALECSECGNFSKHPLEDPP